MRSALTVCCSGRTLDPNPACTGVFLGRMFFDGTYDRTTMTVVGSLKMLDLYVVIEVESQLVSPQSLAEMLRRCVR